jgi:hypothetical protein
MTQKDESDNGEKSVICRKKSLENQRNSLEKSGWIGFSQLKSQ